jgi:O-antigen/teichoic acid export membrane protein
MNNSSASKQRFGRDVLIAGAANLARSLRGLILVPIITGHLSLAHYGEWELLAVAIAFLTPWITSP